MKKISNFLVSKNDQSKRIDIYINSQKKELSRTRIKNLILKEKLKLNNKIIKIPSYKVSIGDKIDLEIPEPKKASLKPYNFKLNISKIKSRENTSCFIICYSSLVIVLKIVSLPIDCKASPLEKSL